MIGFLMLVAVLAAMGNAIATPEQRADARALVKHWQWIPASIIGAVVLWCAAAWGGIFPTH